MLSLQNLYVEALTTMWLCLETGPMRSWKSLNGFVRWGPLSNKAGVLIRRGRENSLCQVRTSKKVAICNFLTRKWIKCTLVFLDFQPPELGKNKCLFKSLTWWYFAMQPELTKITRKSKPKIVLFEVCEFLLILIIKKSSVKFYLRKDLKSLSKTIPRSFSPTFACWSFKISLPFMSFELIFVYGVQLRILFHSFVCEYLGFPNVSWRNFSFSKMYSWWPC
jgi:hypothetical protein